MTFSPAIPTHLLALLMLVLVAVPMLLILRSPRLRHPRTRAAILVLRLAVMALLLLILANPVTKVGRKRPRTPVTGIVLVDTSRSMGLGEPTRLHQGLDFLEASLPEEKDSVLLLPFAGELARAPLALPELRRLPVGGRTCLGAALGRALPLAVGTGARSITVVSDGRVDDPQQLAEAAAAAAAAGVPVSVLPVGEAPTSPNLAVVNALVDRQVPAGSRIPVTCMVRAWGCREQRAEVTLVDAEDGRVLDRGAFPALDGMHQIGLTAALGKEDAHLELRLAPVEGELSTEDNALPFAVSVTEPRLRVLYMEGSNHRDKRWTDTWEYDFIRDALQETGSIDVDVFTVDEQVADGGRLFHLDRPESGYPASREGLFGYDVVICSDINRTIFTEDQLSWTVELVAERGGGFCMIGGYTAFGAGKWDRTVWEQLIPVDMKTESEGYEWETVSPVIPEVAAVHPLWHFDADPAANRRILEAHPPFLGFNLIHRAKPAAKVLAWHEKREMPLICVQPYGRGRSMAFASDAAGGWGERYQTEWGEGERDNRHYRRFWVNAVRWLAENSMSTHRTQLLATTEAIRCTPGETVALRARKLSLVRPEELRRWRVEAWLDSGGESRPRTVVLRLNEQSGTFEGNLVMPAELAGTAPVIRFRAEGPEGADPDEAEVGIRVSAADRELADPAPDPGVLRQIAERTGGRVLEAPSELAALVRPAPRDEADARRLYTVPVWDRGWVWGLIVVLLAGEWVLRKTALFGAT
ncbi:MAG: hypothetical protein JXR77_09195 [Lentisphaeria bacterium]|nr:hypothetical protein [Lentisphaeria bacterium]